MNRCEIDYIKVVCNNYYIHTVSNYVQMQKLKFLSKANYVI